MAIDIVDPGMLSYMYSMYPMAPVAQALHFLPHEAALLIHRTSLCKMHRSCCMSVPHLKA